MKIFYTLSLVFNLLIDAVVAQSPQGKQERLEIIYANDQKNVALFFPDPIRQGITGSENFVFTYNRENQQHLGLLQATPGEESNLLVISNSGLVFSYLVRYSEQLEKLNYFINVSESIGNEEPDVEKINIGEEEATKPNSLASELSLKREENYNIFSSHLLRSNQKIKKVSKAKEGITLKVKNIVFQGEELYFVMEINNNSSIDYEVNYLNISIETKQKGKKKSIQKLAQEPVYKFLDPKEIPRGKSSRFVYVLPKFSIAEDKMVVIDLKERNGERDLKLKLKQEVINNPN